MCTFESFSYMFKLKKIVQLVNDLKAFSLVKSYNITVNNNSEQSNHYYSSFNFSTIH